MHRDISELAVDRSSDKIATGYQLKVVSSLS